MPQDGPREMTAEVTNLLLVSGGTAVRSAEDSGQLSGKLKDKFSDCEPVHNLAHPVVTCCATYNHQITPLLFFCLSYLAAWLAIERVFHYRKRNRSCQT